MPPTQDPDSERRRLVEALQSRGASREEIFSALDKLNGNQPAAPAAQQFDTSQDPFRSVPRVPAPPGTATVLDVPNISDPKVARGLLAGGAAMATAPFTGGMSLIPAALTEGAVAGTADLGLQGLRHLMDPGYDVRPMESLETGVATGVGSGVTRAVLEGLLALSAGRAGIPKPAVAEALQKAPPYSGKAARVVLQRPLDAEYQLAKQAQGSVSTARAPSLPEARVQLKSSNAKVDMQPVFDHIMSLSRTPVNAGEEAANKALEDAAGRLPQEMSLEEFHNWIQRMRRPVRDQIGKEGGTLMAEDLKSIQNFAREYRDKIAGPKAAEAFSASSKEIDAIKRFKSLLLDPKGNLRRSAPNTIARYKGNDVIREVVKKYDAAMKTNFDGLMDDLALNRQWSPKQIGDAGALTEMLAQAAKGRVKMGAGAARSVAKGIVLLGPRGLPGTATGAAAGGVTGYLKESERRVKAKK